MNAWYYYTHKSMTVITARLLYRVFIIINSNCYYDYYWIKFAEILDTKLVDLLIFAFLFDKPLLISSSYSNKEEVFL